VGTRAKRRIEIALGVRKGTTFKAGVRAGEGIGEGREAGRAVGVCGKAFASTNGGSEASFGTSGKLILFVAFISTPEMLPQRSAELPQNSLYLAQVPKEKEWTAKMPSVEVFVNLWKKSEVSYLQLDSYSTGLYSTPVVGMKGPDTRGFE